MASAADVLNARIHRDFTGRPFAAADRRRTLIDVEEDVVICALRRVSSAVERGILLPAGTVLGMDEDGHSVTESTDLVVLDLIQRRDGWLVRYMTLPGSLVAARR